MKRLILLFVLLISVISVPSAPKIQTETIIPKENVVGVYQLNGSEKYYMVFTLNGKRQVASISKTELKKYYLAQELNLDYIIIFQKLKTKNRVIIKMNF